MSNGKIIQPDAPLPWMKHLLRGERADVESLVRVMYNPAASDEMRGMATCAIGMVKQLCLLRERVRHTFNQCSTDDALKELVASLGNKAADVESLIARIIMDTRQDAAKLALKKTLINPRLMLMDEKNWDEQVDRVVNAFKYEEQSNDDGTNAS